MNKHALEIVRDIERQKNTNPASQTTGLRVGSHVTVFYYPPQVEGEKKKTKREKVRFDGVLIGINKKSDSIRVLRSNAERIFPIFSKNIEVQVERVARRRQRRAKLFFLRDLSGRPAAHKL